jgi:hypothetical protein
MTRNVFFWGEGCNVTGHKMMPKSGSVLVLPFILLIYFANAGVGKIRFTVVNTRNTEFILALLFIY